MPQLSGTFYFGWLMLRDRNDSPDLDAATISLQVFAFLLGEDARRSRFLAQSGADVHEFANLIEERAFQAGILDYLMQDEPLLLSFCTECDIAPERVSRAQQILSPIAYDD